MGQKQELKDQKPESSVEHEIKSSSTSEAGQLPADSHDWKQLEIYRVAVCHTFRVGDICVSPYSVNWDCRQASYLQTCGVSQGGNQCVYPEQNFDASASFLFGQCEFYNITKGELALADEVLAALAAKGNQYLPRRNGIVQVGPGHASLGSVANHSEHCTWCFVHAC
jgi:hypothetical protein